VNKKVIKPTKKIWKKKDKDKKKQNDLNDPHSHLKGESSYTKIFGNNLTYEAIIFIEYFLQYIETHGINEQGIYRKNGSNSSMVRLKEYVENNIYLGLHINDQEDIIDVTGCLKLYFREMPEPLLTFELYDAFIAAASSEDITLGNGIIAKVIRMLPHDNRRILKKILYHLNNVAQYANENLMNYSNLAIVFAPSLLRPTMDNPALLIADIKFANELFIRIIQQPDLFFQDQLTQSEVKHTESTNYYQPNEPNDENYGQKINNNKTKKMDYDIQYDENGYFQNNNGYQQNQQNEDYGYSQQNDEKYYIPPENDQINIIRKNSGTIPLQSVKSDGNLPMFEGKNGKRSYRKYTLPPNPKNNDDVKRILDNLQSSHEKHRTTFRLQLQKIQKQMSKEEYENHILQITEKIKEGTDINEILESFQLSY